MTTAASGPVELASTCPLPHAVADSSERHITLDNMRVLRSERLKDTAPALQVAPYQATPICGAITHHHAAGLHIPDESLPEEVSGGYRRSGREVDLLVVWWAPPERPPWLHDFCSPPRPSTRRTAFLRSMKRSRSTRRSCRSVRATTWGEWTGEAFRCSSIRTVAKRFAAARLYFDGSGTGPAEQ